jgi:hypothetical protein
MKIIVKEKTTEFITDRKNEKYLLRALSFYKSTRCLTLRWEVDRFVIKYKLYKSMKAIISREFYNHKHDVISGYSGCLITGHHFKWR